MNATYPFATSADWAKGKIISDSKNIYIYTDGSTKQAVCMREAGNLMNISLPSKQPLKKELFEWISFV